MWTQQNELGMYQPFLWSYRNCCIIHHAFSVALASDSYFLLWLCGVAEVAAFGLWLCGLGWLTCRLLVRVLPALHVLFWDPGRGAALTCGVVFSRCRLEAPRGKSRNTDWFLRPVLLWPLVKASHMVKCSIREGESGNNGDLLNSDFFFFSTTGKVPPLSNLCKSLCENHWFGSWRFPMLPIWTWSFLCRGHFWRIQVFKWL